MSREDIKFCETVESGIVHLDDLHYEMPLPFKHQNIQLPNNYAQAEKRLTGLKKRLKADDRYCADWITGPDFLKEPVKSWLKEETYEDHVDPDSPEVKNVKVNISTVKESSDIVKRLRRFSSWFKAKMVVALCLKYK